MKRKTIGALAGCLAALALAQESAQAQANVPLKVLVLTTAGSGFYAHTNSMNAMVTLLTNSAGAWNVTVTNSTTAGNFTLAYLRGFDVVFLNNVTGIGKAITGTAQSSFIQWMQEGGGAVGVHGVLDHGDTWKWFTDNLAMTRFTSHTGYCADKNSMVKIDVVPTSGSVRAKKPEYATLLSALPNAAWNWCDEWYSFVSNPRNQVDMLMTIDPSTFTPNPSMGADHPVTWTTKLPAGPTGKQGKFFYTDRGHDAPSWADANTKTMLRFALCWAAGLDMGATSCQTPGGVSALPPFTGRSDAESFEARTEGGMLAVEVLDGGAHAVEIYDAAGRMAAQRAGGGPRTHTFWDLRPGSYLIKVRSGFKVRYGRMELSP